jgi:mannose-6-phosphate isomerase
VLSIATALSIQAHPDKKLAEELHKKFPNIYKDDNHKPEVALAVTEMQALCQFRVNKEIVNYLETVWLTNDCKAA